MFWYNKHMFLMTISGPVLVEEKFWSWAQCVTLSLCQGLPEVSVDTHVPAGWKADDQDICLLRFWSVVSTHNGAS